MKSTMSTPLRQLIFMAVTVSFAVGLAWLLLYSSGYNLNITELALQPTGGIRLTVHPSADVVITLLPSNDVSRSADTTFTHVLPGSYQLAVATPGYRPVHVNVQVEPNMTTVIDPLYLWPDQAPLTVTSTPTSPSTLPPAELPIVFQSILASTTLSDQSAYLLITQRQFVVLNQANHTVMEYTRDGSVITSQQLGSDMTDMALDQNRLLLVSQFSLAVVDVTTHTSETITRLSTPISQATWITNTPYIAYSTADTLHMIDSRLQAQYLDQTVATTPEPITDLWYDAELNSVWLVTDAQHYRWPLELVI